MGDTTWERYVAGFRDSLLHWAGTEQELLDQPGILGYLGSSDVPNGRLLITDDRAVDVLRGSRDPCATIAVVHPGASACRAHFSQLPAYGTEHGTAMVAEQLAALPEAGLDRRLTLRRSTLQPSDGQVPLADAAAAFFRFDPPSDREPPTPDAFATYLHSIPNATILTATDATGEIRATAGSAVFGDHARVFFVSTDPAWRGRGIGTAMTAAVLRRARDEGAHAACLEASDSGRTIYLRLGFQDAGPIALFARF